jgi:trans-aconitate methyltransferase
MSPETSLAKRAYLTELMDGPCSFEDFLACMRDLERVNRMVLAYRPTFRWLNEFVPAVDSMHIVDVGSGGGDMLRRIERWASDNYVNARLAGIDFNPHAARAARELTLPSSRIQWITADIFDWQPAAPVDIVVSSIFTHHLEDEQIVQFLQWMERTARRGWLINDLARGPKSYYLFKVLARVMRWHRFIQHDGPVSIRRSFTAEDWRFYIREAGLAHLPIQIVPAWPGRLCVSRIK